MAKRDILRLTDAQLSRILGGGRATIKMLQERDAPQNSDGSWNLLRVFAFFGRGVSRSRKA